MFQNADISAYLEEEFPMGAQQLACEANDLPSVAGICGEHKAVCQNHMHNISADFALFDRKEVKNLA